MFSARFAAALLCAAALAACDRVADPTTGPAPSKSMVSYEGGEFLPGIAVLDPFAIEQVDGGVIESARGGGHFHLGTELRTFSFNAKNRADGSTQGQFQLHNRAANAKEHGDVRCLRVDGNQAYVGGVITHSNIGTEGFSRVWRVVDGGEGGSNQADLISLAFSFGTAGTEQVCRTAPQLAPLFPIESGNLQVRDDQ